MKSRLIPVFLCFVMVVAVLLPMLTPEASANTPAATSIRLDGVHLNLTNPLRMVGSTIYVPLVDFCKTSSRAHVVRENDKDSITVFVPGLRIDANNGSIYLRANGRYLFVQDGCRVIDGVMYVPLRQLVTAFGMKLSMDTASDEVILQRADGPIKHGDSYYDEDELFWLSRIIDAESRSEVFIGKVAVGQVVINRTQSDMFPDTIYDVIFDRHHGVQFTPAHRPSFRERTPSYDCIVAAKLALEGADIVGFSLYFNWKNANSWASRNRTYIMTIGNHDFFA